MGSYDDFKFDVQKIANNQAEFNKIMQINDDKELDMCFYKLINEYKRLTAKLRTSQ